IITRPKAKRTPGTLENEHRDSASDDAFPKKTGSRSNRLSSLLHMKRISIPYFPTGIKYSTPLLLGLGIYLWLIGHPVWLGIIILPTAVILTTSYVTEIDLEKKEFRDFVSILSIPFQEEIITFNRVEK